MAAIDDELLRAAEDDAKEVAFIMNQLPIDVKDKFTDDDIYYCVDVMLEYLETKQTDDDGFIDIDLDEVAKHIAKQAKKEKIGDFEPEDIFFVVQAELDYNETLDNE